jgi:nucleotide-binding universal stress UspA family protein
MAREAPVLIAYDGSEVSRTAVRHAAELFAGRPAVLATVWEPGLAAVPVVLPDTMGVGATGTLPPDPAAIEAVDRLQRERASTVAADGAVFARSVGLVAEPQAVPDEVDVADTLIDIAREREAAVVVVGSHGIGLRRRLLGSVSRKLIEHCDRPVLVIRDDSA